tara:strand:+ start:304 stop:960 length:657 start_codon:yes stop_codon:yes gene_type:complete
MPIKVTGWDSSTGRMKKAGTSDSVDIDGSINIGDANTDAIIVNAEFDSHLIPDDNVTYDLGSESKKWRNGYFEGLQVVGAVIGKVRHFTTHKYSLTSSNDAIFIRFNAAGSNTSGGVNNRFVAPADGKLLKVIVRSDSTPGNTEVAFCKITNGTSTFGSGSPVTDVMLNLSTADNSYTATFSNNNTFSAGNVLGIRLNPQNNHGNVDVTIVWEMDWNT